MYYKRFLWKSPWALIATLVVFFVLANENLRTIAIDLWFDGVLMLASLVQKLATL